MTNQQYEYRQNTASSATPTSAKTSSDTIHPTKVTLPDDQCAGHGDHWNILTDNITDDVPNWLQQSIDEAIIPCGLHVSISKDNIENLLLSCNSVCHINQILSMENGKPNNFINAYPCVNSPYGLICHIDRIIANDNSQDAVLRLVSEDGSIIYAFDQLYSVNHSLYRDEHPYFVNFSAWAYNIEPSQQDEVIKIEDPETVRYHRAFNEIVVQNKGVVPEDLETQIKEWQTPTDEPLAPIEINLGHMCAYLFGETLGQEDEAWCQGQVLGKQEAKFFEQDITVFDVAILREPDATPFVIRMATPTSQATTDTQVNDYIQANIWLQAAIYQENQPLA